ncbi:HWE histidine kinase domain-containing protein [Aureimonas leprariae]|uniref:Blue-light-activated histidine kinase n=1 Tax=Plantimonas leprariae TaxID=2615207 RepID=A0A7V7PS51_9HYPH|nr:HWE histidine kinase domain-containing protein [Aureimonas leprariae]KAB0681867.1 PAS domain-containing protein [Aureimonas leprariae]
MPDDQEQRRILSELHGTGGSSDPFASAVRTTRMPMIITDPRQDDNPIVFCNGSFLQLSGFSREEVLGRNCRFLQGTGTNAEDVAKVREAVETRTPIEIDLLNYKKNGESFWNRLLISPVFDDGELTYFFASQYDVTPERESMQRMQLDQATLEDEIRQRVFDLTQSEERLNFTLRAGRLGSWTLELADQRLVASNLCKEIFGRAASDGFAYEDLIGAIQSEDRSRWHDAVDAAVADGGDFDIEFRVELPGDEVRWVEVRGQPSSGPDGRAVALAGVALDVTQRKRAEEHRLLLVRELNHRVKNTLATVQSIVRQSLRSSRTVAEAGEVADSRIRALSMAHDVLTEESWSGASMGDLVAQALKPFTDAGNDRFDIGGDAVRLKPRTALAISMAVHELATNAVKYGALSNETGTVRFRWTVGPAKDEPMLHIRWEESGGPPVEKPRQVGFGSRLIERALASEIGGTTSIDYRPTGLVFTVDAPLAGLTAPEE